MNKLFMAMSISLLGHIIAWFHMQGQFKYEWAKSLWWIVLVSGTSFKTNQVKIPIVSVAIPNPIGLTYQ